MQIIADYPLDKLNTFGLRSRAEQFVAIDSLATLQACIASPELRALHWHVLGGGSNLVLPEVVPGLVLKMALMGRSLHAEDADAWYVSGAGGENWHEFVQWTLAMGWAGLENLSLIPGTVGAAPVQNIGAYGVEVKDVLHSLTAVHLETGEVREFSRAECQFAYRDSFFKQAAGRAWCIVAVTFRLPKVAQLKTSYGDIEQELARQQLSVSAANIAAAVIAVRQRKLPDPAVIGNAGSYFKNPIVPTEQAQALKQQWPALVSFAVDDKHNKLAAGWLIDQAGWKGKQLGPVGMYAQQALVMVNHGGASQQDVKKLEFNIQAAIAAQYGVKLEAEPIFW
ncbi:UDP-N-acetylmuramate dehydrogenase [Chitinibacter tainanensis]|uniref:UDP-N-acetylmuramate dehydrogenase n=1 Tax=Chitinibacter tainanensis TaxID=230667 RepID=UPI0003FF3AF6|nr:UDP-N-acetylmuramate dehydrogenase [Chitinibacter tainanensis]